MVKVVIDIPKEKMSSFLNMIVSLGIDNHAILSQPASPNKGRSKALNPLRSFKKFLLFDWEFFNNELEFE